MKRGGAQKTHERFLRSFFPYGGENMRQKSEKERQLWAQFDALQLGTGWVEDDIGKLQILVEDETSDAMAFLNEKFVFSRIAKYLMGDGKRVILSPETKKGFLNYLDSLFYYLKYRNYDAEMLEMMLMGFKAGVLVADDLKEQES